MSHAVPPAVPEPAPAAPEESAPPPYSPSGLPFDGAGAPKAPSRPKKLARIGGSILVAGVAAASWTGLGGSGVPEVGDCGRASGDDSFEVVECDSGEAEFRVVGVEEEKMTLAEYEADTEACTSFATAGSVLWVGDEFGLDGTVLCAEPA